jgi:hypothetical protein
MFCSYIPPFSPLISPPSPLLHPLLLPSYITPFSLSVLGCTYGASAITANVNLQDQFAPAACVSQPHYLFIRFHVPSRCLHQSHTHTSLSFHTSPSPIQLQLTRLFLRRLNPRLTLRGFQLQCRFQIRQVALKTPFRCLHHQL